MKELLKFVFVLYCLLSTTVLLAAETTTLENLTIMALGPLDGRAVVKTSEGKMQVLKVGDTIPGTKAVVSQVLTDKLVVQETIEKEGKPAVTQTAWILKSAKPGETSRVMRLDREGPAKPPILKPTTTELQKVEGPK